MKKTLINLTFCLSLLPSISFGLELNFAEAKQVLRERVFHDQNGNGTFYCGCTWRWVGKTGGRVNHDSCDYNVRRNLERAARTEFEHIVPMSNLGRSRQCWQRGGRNNCTANDLEFSRIEGDPFNLRIAVGEVNADRADYRFSQFDHGVSYGSCGMRIDFKGRAASPPPATRGQIARTYFYMHDRYSLPISKQQERLFIAWDKAHPVTANERLIHDRIAKIVGRENPYVTGAKVWGLQSQ